MLFLLLLHKKRLQGFVKNVRDWKSSNKLKLNSDKTELLLTALQFCAKHQILPLKESWLKKQFSSTSQVGVCAKLFQWFEVNNALPVLNAGHFASAKPFLTSFKLSKKLCPLILPCPLCKSLQKTTLQMLHLGPSLQLIAYAFSLHLEEIESTLGPSLSRFKGPKL